MRQTFKEQSGVMLLEVLVALVIFAIGALGLIGMQAMAVKLAGENKFRGEAGMYVDQLINQMWADDRTISVLQANYNTGGVKYLDWKNQIQAVSGLPGAADYPPLVAIDAAGKVVVTVRWKAPSEQHEHTFLAVAQVN